MKEQTQQEFNQNQSTEFNSTYSESNEVNIVNNYERSDFVLSKQEINASPPFKEISTVQSLQKTNHFNVITKFIVLCSVVAVTQPSITIPIISQLFSSEQPSTAIASYEIEIGSTHNRVTYTLTTENVTDIEDADYSLIVVESGNETQEYISSIPQKYIDENKTKVKSKTSSGSFSYFATKTGIKKIAKNSNYAVVLLKGKEIVKTQNATTKDFIYITDVKIEKYSDLSKKYLRIYITANSEFTNFKEIYFRYINITTNTEVEDFSKLPKGSLDVLPAGVGFYINDPVCEYKIEFYCSTDNPSEFDEESLANSFIKEGITYYYIQTYSGIKY